MASYACGRPHLAVQPNHQPSALPPQAECQKQLSELECQLQAAHAAQAAQQARVEKEVARVQQYVAMLQVNGGDGKARDNDDMRVVPCTGIASLLLPPMQSS